MDISSIDSNPKLEIFKKEHKCTDCLEKVQNLKPKTFRYYSILFFIVPSDINDLQTSYVFIALYVHIKI